MKKEFTVGSKAIHTPTGRECVIYSTTEVLVESEEAFKKQSVLVVFEGTSTPSVVNAHDVKEILLG